MNRKILLCICLFVSYSEGFEKESLLSHTILFLSPQTISKNELNSHKKIASDAFFLYDTSINAVVETKEYYDGYFENFFNAYVHTQENELFLLGAYNQQGKVIGGLYGRIVAGPHEILGLRKDTEAYCINCVYVDPKYQNNGVATSLIRKLVVTAQKQNKPILLYTYAVHTAARKIYEKCGFTLITDKGHPDGHWTDAAQALFFGDRCITDPVAYRKD